MKRMKLLTLVPAVVTISGVLIGVVWYLCEPRADDIDRDALGMYRTAQGIAKAGVQDPITPGSADALVARLQDRGNGGIANLVVASDGKRLATTCVDGTMKVWDIQERKLIREAWSGQDNVSGPVVISTDGKVLAWGTNDAQILLCDLDKPGQAKVLRGHMDRISALAFSPDGLLLASGSRDKSVRVWDLLRRGVVKAELRDQIDYPTALCFSPDGHQLACAGTKPFVRLRDIPSGREAASVDTETASNCIAFVEGGRFLVYGASGKVITLWDIHHKMVAARLLLGEYSRLSSLTASVDGTLLAAGDVYGLVKVWELPSKRELANFYAYEAPVTGLGFMPDGSQLVTANAGVSNRDKSIHGEIRMWNLR